MLYYQILHLTQNPHPGFLFLNTQGKTRNVLISQLTRIKSVPKVAYTGVTFHDKDLVSNY